MCYLYWLHLPEHTLDEGYIGVTYNPKKRLNEHKNNVDNSYIKNALVKYNNQIQYSILLQANEEYCYRVEELLRPYPKIGWNIAKGGIISGMSGRKHTKKTKQQMSESHKNKKVGKDNPMFGRKRPDLVALNKNKAKNYTFINPQEKIICVYNLRDFCRKNNLDVGAMWRVAVDKQQTHKGWVKAKRAKQSL